MNANAFIDQAAADHHVRRRGGARGVPEGRWVHLHGCADGHDHWYLTERADIARSARHASVARVRALAMAGKTIDQIDISISFLLSFGGRNRLSRTGAARRRPARPTITGGLPYFGGPGNSYVLHSISEMIRQTRAARQVRPVTANGNYITKHSWGVIRRRRRWGHGREKTRRSCRRKRRAAQGAFTETFPAAAIETYTIMHGREWP